MWGLAISLAKEHVEKRLPEVVNTVAGRLMEVERFEAAGELYEDISAMKEVSIHPFTFLSMNFINLNWRRRKEQETILYVCCTIKVHSGALNTKCISRLSKLNCIVPLLLSLLNAGDLWKSRQLQAASMYMQAGLWEKARAVGTSSGPPLQQVGISELQCMLHTHQ